MAGLLQLGRNERGGFGDFRNRVAVVTGASSGLGREMVRQLANRGMHVAAVARRGERIDALVEELQSRARSASAYVCDISDRGQVEQTAKDVIAARGRVDLLVNAAGSARHVLFKDHEIDDIQRLMQINYMGTVYWIKALLPQMRSQGSGWIVNFSSLAGKIGQADEAAYSATKFAITGLSEALAGEFAPLGIGVLCVHPVLVRTEMFDEEVLARMPESALKRFIDPPEFVSGVLKALRRGRTEAVIPESMRWVPILRSLMPGVIGRTIARVKLKALPDVTT